MLLYEQQTPINTTEQIRGLKKVQKCNDCLFKDKKEKLINTKSNVLNEVDHNSVETASE